ncbi:thioesterase [Streptococcus uberis]|nr:thioesterase [Streptococcus uberis]
MEYKQSVKLKEIKIFENYTFKLVEFGHVIVSTEVVESSLNYYGMAHGGYLFTLCDQIAGLTVISTGFEAVTLQSNINYLKAGHTGDTLFVEGSCVHNGKTTKVIDIVITNQAGQLITKASCTMFVTGKSDRAIKKAD